MSDNLIKNYTQNNTGAVTALNGAPITESVLVPTSLTNIPLTADYNSPELIPLQTMASLPLSSTPVPNSRGVNDVSDTSPASSPVNIPIRGEKRFIPTVVNTGIIDVEFNDVKNGDFYTYANTEAKRLQNGVDYIKIRIPHRGVNLTTGQPDPTQAVEYRFLVNPATMTINRQTVDSQSLTRGGWQFGVWGEDTFMVQMQGVSAGTYFTNGLTDEFSYYAVSYRNMMQLQRVFENNGYFFEGEEADEGPLAADYMRRRIRMHQDVELWSGNFIWYGMFDSFTISDMAEHPFMMEFQLNFFVWKERYRSSSPYWGSIENNVQRGHSYDAVEGTSATIQSNNTLALYSPSGVNSQGIQMESALATASNAPYQKVPAVRSSVADDLIQPAPTFFTDQIGIEPAQQLLA